RERAEEEGDRTAERSPHVEMEQPQVQSDGRPRAEHHQHHAAALQGLNRHERLRLHSARVPRGAAEWLRCRSDAARASVSTRTVEIAAESARIAAYIAGRRTTRGR